MPMDTLRDKNTLQKLWETNKAPWKVWDKQMFNDIYKIKVLVTGHTGFKGTWLTTWLIKLGADVVGISKDIPTHPSMFEELNLEDKIRLIL